MCLVLQDIDSEVFVGDIVMYSSTCENSFAKATFTYLEKQVCQGQVKPVNAKIIAVIVSTTL